MPYSQLSESERYVICHMRQAGCTQAAMARELGRSPGTISRELARNADPRNPRGGYFYDTAQRLADERRDDANRRYKLDDADSPLGRSVREGLAQRWSPQQIVGRLRRDHAEGADGSMRVTHETIYRWVYRRSVLGETLHQRLRRRRARRKRRIPGERDGRGRIPGRVGIEQRPAIVEQRARFGDWESDTVEGAKGRGALATHVERKSRYVLVRKLDDKRADTFNRATIAALGTIPAELRHTLTADNGKEFAAFAQLERRLKLGVYFADPHAPWQRGANEHTNGLLRDFFPKGVDLSRVSPREVAIAQRMLNNRPRKCLDYRTPREVLNALPGVALRN
jgi:IS30 family transposase